MRTIRKVADVVPQKQQQDGNQFDSHPTNRSDNSAHKAQLQTEGRSMEPRLNARKARPWTSEEDDILADLVAGYLNDLPSLWRKLDRVYLRRLIGNLPLYRSESSSRMRWYQLDTRLRSHTGPWDTMEIMNLKHAIQEQVGDGFQVMVNIQQVAGAIPADEKAKTETLGQDTRPLLELGGPELEGLDWHKVAE
ncbi:hypothetical protein BG011_002870 [Mortierella polycephala]|uniref:Myb-like domain-containing protein n=1 Tax=Mortierella polycephala TaxID=41804 RepID=A0A9P6Q484_9FUNG|nr:hypothetical protein BG011_002870 [Mortierella polycephala]